MPEPRLAALLERLGVRLPQEAVVDPLSHYARDSEMVAVTGYGEEAITRGLSMTFFAGVRPLVPVPPAEGLVATPLFASSRDSYTRAVQPAGVREHGAAPRAGSAPARRGRRRGCWRCRWKAGCPGRRPARRRCAR